MVKRSTNCGGQAISEDNAEATHEQNRTKIPIALIEEKPVAKPSGSTARRMIKSMSNKSIRNLVSGAKKTSIAEDSSSTAKKSINGKARKYRPRSHTLETLERQGRDDGLQFRPRADHVLSSDGRNDQ